MVQESVSSAPSSYLSESVMYPVIDGTIQLAGGNFQKILKIRTTLGSWTKFEVGLRKLDQESFILLLQPRVTTLVEFLLVHVCD